MAIDKDVKEIDETAKKPAAKAEPKVEHFEECTHCQGSGLDGEVLCAVCGGSGQVLPSQG